MYSVRKLIFCGKTKEYFSTGKMINQIIVNKVKPAIKNDRPREGGRYFITIKRVVADIAREMIGAIS